VAPVSTSGDLSSGTVCNSDDTCSPIARQGPPSKMPTLALATVVASIRARFGETNWLDE
jgi:hypothetical protein